MNKKKICSFFLALVILSQTILVSANGLDVTAKSFIVIDYETGETLASKNPDKLLPPASITKVMTTYIIFEELEKGNLTKDTLVNISPHVAQKSRSKNYPMWVSLNANQKYTVEHLIELIMIPSASASCIAMAEHISGSEANFVKRMNETARKLGMDGEFKNSHGAHYHETTARSLAILLKSFIDRFPEILNYTSKQYIMHNGSRYNILNELLHKNKYPGCDGFKTGTTSFAKYCLSATAKRDNRRVIAISLGSSSNYNRYKDAPKILDAGFMELTRRDNMRKNTTMNFTKLPEEVRLNTEYSLPLEFSNVGGSYQADGKFYVNGRLVGEFENLQVADGNSVNLKICPNKNLENLELKFELVLPRNIKNEVVKNIQVKNETPALYKDIDGNESEDKIVYLSEKGLLQGDENGYFKVDKNTTRGEFLTILGRALEYLEIEEIENRDNNYEDVNSSDYYNKYISWADEKDIVRGHNNKFMPKDEITKEEVSIILARFMETYNLESGDGEGLDLELIGKKSSLNRVELTNIIYEFISSNLKIKEEKAS